MLSDQSFKLSIAGLSDTGLDLSLTLDSRWFTAWQTEDHSLDFTAPEGLDLKLRVQRHGRDILLRGHLAGEMELTCGRCLATFRQPVAGDFDLLLVPGPEPVSAQEEELSADELSLDYYTGDVVDLEAILREQILLLLPLKPLCTEACQGLCPGCGVDLNRAACTCPPGRFASPLATLAEKLKKS